MFKKLLVSTAAAATVALAACGGGGGADVVTPPTGGGTNPPPAAARYAVAGPMDAVQAPVSSQVFGQLGSAVDGTPLEGLFLCADRAVNQDALDIADTVANALQAAAAAGSPDPAALAATAASINASVMQLVNDLQGLLNALAGTGGCGSNGQPVGAATGVSPFTGALAASPLAPLATQLSGVLGQLSAIHPGSGGVVLPLSTLEAYLGQISNQFDAGIAGVLTLEPGVANTAVLAGVLYSVQTMLGDVEGLVGAVATADTDAVKAALNALLANALTNELTRAVPLRAIELQGGEAGFFSLPIQAGALDVATVFSDAVGTVFTTQALKNQLTAALEPVLDPIVTQVLPVLADQLVLAILHMEPGDGVTGTSLDTVLNAVTELLGPVGGVGQPVDSILDLVAGAVQAGAGGELVCPSTNPVLNLLCGLDLGLGLPI
jgi:hypothetical protein